MMELTKQEKALIQAYRNGAEIDVNYFDVKTVDEAIEKVNEFSEVKKISDQGTAVMFTNWSTFMDESDIEVTCFLYLNEKGANQ